MTENNIMKEQKTTTVMYLVDFDYKYLRKSYARTNVPTKSTVVIRRHRRDFFDTVSALLLVCIYVCACVLAYQEVEGAQLEAINSGPIHLVKGVKGGRAALPCDITPLHPNDRYVLVLWYKDGIGTPIHSHDSRGSSGRSKEWSDFKTFGERVRFDLMASPSSLILERLKPKDAGLYRCRVDFKKSPTRNARANLTVIIPPTTPEIRHSSGQPAYSMVGPYDEGSQLKLICEAADGDPPPSLVWKLGRQIIDGSYEAPRPGLVTNTLTILELQREHLHASVICEASNTNLTAPLSTMLTIEMNLKPVSVRILGSREPLSAGREYEIVCQSTQGRPPAVISWYLDGVELTEAKPAASSNSMNVSLSTVRINAEARLNTVSLTCMAKSPVINHRPIEDTWQLEIYYAPEVVLGLGSPLNADNIKEGRDIYFECAIRSNPPVFRIDWFHNGKPLIYNATGGVIVSSQSMALQKVRRTQAGSYSCTAYNTEGDARSNDLQLIVQYPPTCAPGQPKVFGAARDETILVPCTLDAVPPVSHFNWRFNSSGDMVNLAKKRVPHDGFTSSLEYTIKNELDYGTLLCWGVNPFGLQTEPCVFRIVAAEAPDNLENCTIRNHPNETLSIRCEAGYGGGLKQLFIAEVRDRNTKQLLLNITELDVPYFQLVGLEADTNFIVEVYATNNKGTSPKQILRGYTDKDFTERHIAQVRHQPIDQEVRGLPVTQIMGAVVGIVGFLVLMIIVVLLRVRLKKDKGRHPSKVHVTVATGENKDEDPDVIPCRPETSDDGSRLVTTPIEGGFKDTDDNSSRRTYSPQNMIPVSGALPYPEIIYQIHPHPIAVSSPGSPDIHHAYLISPENVGSPHHHILPRPSYLASSETQSPTESESYTSYSPAPTNNDSKSSQRSSPTPIVSYRPQIIYTSSAVNPAFGAKRTNPKDYYDSLPYPPDAYNVPISIPTSPVGTVLYHVPKSSLSSDRNETSGYSDTLSECSDSSASFRRSHRDPLGLLDRPGSNVSSPLPLITEERQKLIYNTLPYENSKKPFYATKRKSDDHSSRSSVIRPVTTKKRELSSAFSPLLANQKESEV